MNNVFVLCNQHNEFLSKSHEWLASGDSKTLYRSAHRDEVINEKVELTVKRPDLRIKLLSAEQAQNGRLMIDGEDCLPKAPAAPECDGDNADAQTDLLISDSDKQADSDLSEDAATPCS